MILYVPLGNMPFHSILRFGDFLTLIRVYMALINRFSVVSLEHVFLGLNLLSQSKFSFIFFFLLFLKFYFLSNFSFSYFNPPIGTSILHIPNAAQGWAIAGEFFTQASSRVPLVYHFVPWQIFHILPILQLICQWDQRVIYVSQIATSLYHLTDKLIRQFNPDFLWILVSKTYSIGYYFISKVVTFYFPQE